jgi:4-amino-4-deoxy-L-arabinose transferase-like glycosyltransferase
MSPIRPFDAVRSLIEQRPEKAFVAFAVLHVALWTILPTALYPNLPLDLIEALTYGREWQLGYDKLPPLPWWVIEILYRVIGADIAYYLVAQLTVLAAFAAVWACARRIVGASGALLSVLIIDGLHYFSFTAPKFNHDVIQLPFWALAGYAFHAALRRRRPARDQAEWKPVSRPDDAPNFRVGARVADKSTQSAQARLLRAKPASSFADRALLHWALLGFALGMGLWAKYFVVVLALPLALFLCIDREARPVLATPGPYVAAAIALLVASPHLVWLVENDFLPFKYAEARAAPVRGIFDHVLHPVVFMAAQLAWLMPALLIAFPLVYPRDLQPAAKPLVAPDAFDRRIVTLLAFGPTATLLVGAALSGRGLITMWGYPLWLFLGLWIVMMAPMAFERIRVIRVACIWGAVAAVYALVFIVQYAVLPHLDHRYRASVFPGDRLATHIADGFRDATGRPLTYVIGSMWLGGNISHYASEHPRTLIDGKPERAPWIDPVDLRARGAAVIWSDGDRTTLPAEYAAIASAAVVQPPFTLPMRWGNGDMTFGWAIVKPN